MRSLHLLLAAALLPAGCGVSTPDLPRALGTLERERLELVAPAAELIRELPVRKGLTVAAGEVIARLDSRSLDARLGEIDAAERSARATLAELLRGTRPEAIAEAEAGRQAVVSSLADAETDLQRIRSLVERGAEPQSRLDRSEARAQELRAQVAAADATLERLVNGATAEQIDIARARIGEVEAQRRAVQVAVDERTVVAPEDGVIEAVPYRVGERPSAGATLAVLLAGPLYARVYVPASLRERAEIGAEVWLDIEGIEGTRRGTLRTISSEAAFTPYFALTERDRGRLAYLAEIDLAPGEETGLPVGVPVRASFEDPAPDRSSAAR